MENETTVETIDEPTVKRSAPLLLGGFITFIVGQIMAIFGIKLYLQSLRPYSDPDTFMFYFGGIIALIGIVLVAVGFYRLASNVDEINAKTTGKTLK